MQWNAWFIPEDFGKESMNGKSNKELELFLTELLLKSMKNAKTFEQTSYLLICTLLSKLSFKKQNWMIFL